MREDGSEEYLPGSIRRPATRRTWYGRLARAGFRLAVVLLVTPFLGPRFSSREAATWFDGKAEVQQGLARGVERWISRDLGQADYGTGHDLFNGEWLFGTYQMAALGFGQTALEHPEWREGHVALMHRCAESMVSEEVRAFDAWMWGEDPLEHLDSGGDHGAYYGYLNLVLSLLRLLDPETPFADLNDHLSAALEHRFMEDPHLLVETYPGQAFPVDMAAGIGSLGLHTRATGAGHDDLVHRWSARSRAAWIDPATGLLVQQVDPGTGMPLSPGRGSGTALAAYFLSFADPSLSADLFSAMQLHMAGAPLGFGMMREYAPGFPGGFGDVDSGPVILGYGVSATGFTLAGARIYGDRELYTRLYATADLFGAPLSVEDRLEFVTGGPLGNALLFAMLTAQPAGRFQDGGAP